MPIYYYAGAIFAYLLLFFALGKSADFLLVNTKSLSEKLGIRLFFVGIILGLFTTLPELFIGLNALASGLDMLPVGNLIGGVVVLFTLVLGGGIILNRRIETDGKYSAVIPKFIFLLLPLILGAKGSINHYDGIAVILIYFLLIYYNFRTEKTAVLAEESVYSVSGGKLSKLKHFAIRQTAKVVSLKKTAGKEIVFIFIGVGAILLISNLIVSLSEITLKNIGLSDLTFGLIFFSIGTNLPEIIITIKAWVSHAGELSVSHLIGSAMANVLVLGIFAIFNNFTFSIYSEYFFLLTSLILVLGITALFYRSGKVFSRFEGYTLVAGYFIFIFYKLYFLPN